MGGGGGIKERRQKAEGNLRVEGGEEGGVGASRWGGRKAVPERAGESGRPAGTAGEATVSLGAKCSSLRQAPSRSLVWANV